MMYRTAASPRTICSRAHANLEVTTLELVGSRGPDAANGEGEEVMGDVVDKRCGTCGRVDYKARIQRPPPMSQDEVERSCFLQDSERCLLHAVDRFKGDAAQAHKEVGQLASLILEAFRSTDPRKTLGRVIDVDAQGFPSVNFERFSSS